MSVAYDVEFQETFCLSYKEENSSFKTTVQPYDGFNFHSKHEKILRAVRHHILEPWHAWWVKAYLSAIIVTDKRKVDISSLANSIQFWHSYNF